MGTKNEPAVLRTVARTFGGEIYLVGIDESEDGDPGPAIWNEFRRPPHDHSFG